jgi:hypothetical protein
MGLPLLHISFKYRPNKIPVPAKGIIAIGQFGIGIINISQFGVGIISIGQFTIAAYALAIHYCCLCLGTICDSILISCTDRVIY